MEVRAGWELGHRPPGAAGRGTTGGCVSWVPAAAAAALPPGSALPWARAGKEAKPRYHGVGQFCQRCLRSEGSGGLKPASGLF